MLNQWNVKLSGMCCVGLVECQIKRNECCELECQIKWNVKLSGMNAVLN